MRLDLSDKTFLSVHPPRTTTGYLLLERKRDVFGKAEHLGGIKIPVEDLVGACVTVMLQAGITAAEIVAEVFGQIHDIDPEIIEYCIRR